MNIRCKVSSSCEEFTLLNFYRKDELHVFHKILVQSKLFSEAARQTSKT